MKHVAEAKMNLRKLHDAEMNLKKLHDAEMILTTNTTTTVAKRALVDAQQNIYSDAGDELLTAAFKGHTSKTQ